MEIQVQKQYHEDLLAWCTNIHLNWERMKPRFSKLFDLKSVEEWENSCCKLQEKLQSDLKVDIEDYYSAINLYEHWELLYGESQGYREEVESDVRRIAGLPSDSDKGNVKPGQTIDTAEELNKEWNELILMANNLEIPIQEIRKFLLDYQG